VACGAPFVPTDTLNLRWPYHMSGPASWTSNQPSSSPHVFRGLVHSSSWMTVPLVEMSNHENSVL
jgi:hypothetical protein